MKRRRRGVTRKKRGGSALAAGGFGCVFGPALACSNSKNANANANGSDNESNPGQQRISKLMLSHHADEEYKEIESIRAKLKSVPNQKDYFLLNDITLCKPAPLSKDDLRQYSSTCKSLIKDNITAGNINQQLDKLKVLSMPNGGVAMDDFIYAEKSARMLLLIQERLVELLRRAILPMNAAHVFHCDIKDSNILVQSETAAAAGNPLRTRLIDWGLSTTYVPKKKQAFPSSWRNRPLQFNVPFSVILFSDDFVEQYTAYLKKNGTAYNETLLRPFVVDYLRFWMEKRGPGHYKFINEIFFMLFSHTLTNVAANNLANMVETEFTLNYIVNYLMDVLKHFTVVDADGKFSVRNYLDDCFVHIVDLWGFVSVYFCYLELLFNNYDELNPVEKSLFDSLRTMFLTYCFLPRHEPIRHTKLFTDLAGITALLRRIAVGSGSMRSITETATPTQKSSGSKTKKSKTKKGKTNPASKSALSTAGTYKKRPKLTRFKNPIFLQG